MTHPATLIRHCCADCGHELTATGTPTVTPARASHTLECGRCGNVSTLTVELVAQHSPMQGVLTAVTCGATTVDEISAATDLTAAHVETVLELLAEDRRVVCTDEGWRPGRRPVNHDRVRALTVEAMR